MGVIGRPGKRGRKEILLHSRRWEWGVCRGLSEAEAAMGSWAVVKRELGHGEGGWKGSFSNRIKGLLVKKSLVLDWGILMSPYEAF